MAIALIASPTRFQRFVDALIDPGRCTRTVIVTLIGYVLVWTIYGIIAKASQDVHFDMAEAVVWARNLDFNNPKHPPLSAWIVKLWFSLFPLTDGSFYLLAMVVAATGLWLAWVASGHWLSPEKRVAGLAFLTFVPFFNFHALKYNANTVLIPLWAATTLCFLRTFETRRIGWAALTGVAAAGAMLGKYWSVVLILGLALVALADPRRKLFFRSAAPWVIIAVGAVVLAPHVTWAMEHHFSPIRYAFAKHSIIGEESIIGETLMFLLGTVAYAAVPIVLLVLLVRPNRVIVADLIWPTSIERRLPVCVFWAPLAVASLLPLAFGVSINSLWAMPMLTLLSVVLLSSPRIKLTRHALEGIVSLAMVFPAIMVVAAPGIALAIHGRGLQNHSQHYRLLAQTVEEFWHDVINQPLRLVASDTGLANGIAFYAQDRPSTLDLFVPGETPWTDDSRIAREGVVLICPVNETACLGATNALAERIPKRQRLEIEVARSFLGIKGLSERYLIEAILPRSREWHSPVNDVAAKNEKHP